MRIFRTLLSTAVFLLVAVVAYGQLSDQQVINEVKRLQATGASQQQILTELAAKGVTGTGRADLCRLPGTRRSANRNGCEYGKPHPGTFGTCGTGSHRSAGNTFARANIGFRQKPVCFQKPDLSAQHEHAHP